MLTGVVADADDDGTAASAPAPRSIDNARQQVVAKKPVTASKEAELKKRIREEFIEKKGIDKTLVNETVTQKRDSGLSGDKLYEAVILELEKL